MVAYVIHQLTYNLQPCEEPHCHPVVFRVSPVTRVLTDIDGLISFLVTHAASRTRLPLSTLDCTYTHSISD